MDAVRIAGRVAVGMRAIVSDLQRAVFQVDDERLVAVANIIRVDNKKRRKTTFLCLAG